MNIKAKHRSFFFIIFLLTFLLLLSACSNEQDKINELHDELQINLENAGKYRFLIKEDGVYGYIDEKGNRLLEPIYKYAHNFKEGLALVSIDGNKFGFINEKFELVIPYEYDLFHSLESPISDKSLLGDFSNGIAVVYVNGYYRYIDKDNKFINDEEYTTAHNFENNVGIAINKDGKTVVINKEGNIIFTKPERYEILQAFENKFLLTNYSVDFFVNNKGERISYSTPAQTYLYTQLSEGMVPFRNGDITTLMGFVNEFGEVVIEPKFTYAGRFSEGLAIARDPSTITSKKEGKVDITTPALYGYINEYGRFSINPKYPVAYNFSEGFARVGDYESLWFIDKFGREVFIQKFKQANDFQNGVALVLTHDNIYQYINKSGDIIWYNKLNGPEDDFNYNEV